MNLKNLEKFEKLENATIHCQLSRVTGGMLGGTTGSATDKATCNAGMPDNEADDHDASFDLA